MTGLPEAFKNELYQAILDAKITELPSLEQRRVALGRLIEEFKKNHGDEIKSIAEKSSKNESASEENDVWTSLVTELMAKK